MTTSSPDTSGEWRLRRAELVERWTGKGLTPMTAFEMVGAVERDAYNTILDSDDGRAADYDRRNLLNLASHLLDALDAATQRAEKAEAARKVLRRLIWASWSPATGRMVLDRQVNEREWRAIVAWLDGGEDKT